MKTWNLLVFICFWKSVPLILKFQFVVNLYKDFCCFWIAEASYEIFVGKFYFIWINHLLFIIFLNDNIYIYNIILQIYMIIIQWYNFFWNC